MFVIDFGIFAVEETIGKIAFEPEPPVVGVVPFSAAFDLAAFHRTFVDLVRGGFVENLDFVTVRQPVFEETCVLAVGRVWVEFLAVAVWN